MSEFLLQPVRLCSTGRCLCQPLLRIAFVDEDNKFRNRDVKVYLVRHFGSSIDFTVPDEARKSSIVYNVSCNTASRFAEEIRSTDPIQECARLLR